MKKEKAQMQVVKVKLTSWAMTILVCWDCKPKDILKSRHARNLGKVIKDSLKTDDDDYGGSCYRDMADDHIVIWLWKAPKTPWGMNALVHEAVHAAVGVMKRYSIPLERYKTEEVLTTVSGYIVEETIRHMYGETI